MEAPWEEGWDRRWIFHNEHFFFSSFILAQVKAEMDIQLQIRRGCFFSSLCWYLIHGVLIIETQGQLSRPPKLLLYLQDAQGCSPNMSSVHRKVTAHQDPPSSYSWAGSHTKENEKWLFLTEKEEKQEKEAKKEMKWHPPYHLKPGA